MTASTTHSAGELVAQAEEAAQRNDWEKAAELLAKAPTQTSAVLGTRAFYLSRAKRYAEALELLTRLCELEPSVVRWPYMVGYQHYEQKQYADALPWFRRALTLDPSHFKTMYRSAQALHQLGREKQAQIVAGRGVRLWHRLLDDAKERERQHAANLLFLLGRAQLRSDPRGAAEILRLAVEYDPRDHHKRYRLGQALRRSGMTAEAINELREAERIKPETHTGVELAAALLAADHRVEAVRQLHRVSGRCRGWTALKAARLARDAGAAELARDLYAAALRERAVRDDFDCRTEAEAVSDAPRPVADADPAGPQTGRVDVVREDRNFGFLVGPDGTRRHFRLNRGTFRVGQRVTYRPIMAEKGPGASDVAPV